MRVLVMAILGLSILAGSGCKPSDEKFCAKMKELYGDRMDDCATDALPELKKECPDPDAAMKCMMSASDKKAADSCFKDLCGKK